ncbi:hypothetical protein JCM11251_007332 [Rhodosporidiobolus azoricus]
MTTTNAPAEPNPELVIRKLDQHITIFSTPFMRGPIPFGGRSTAISLKDGSVFLAASTPLDPPTLDTITSMGQVKHIAVFDSEHTMYTPQYRKAFPDAHLYLPSGAVTKFEKNDPSVLPSDKSLLTVFGTENTTGERGASGAEDPLSKATGGEVQSADFGKAFVNEDIAFYHGPSKTMIQADLLFNLPPTEQYSRSSSRSTLPLISSAFQPGKTLQQRMLYHGLAKDKAEMKRMAERVEGWDFDRIIPCHGDVIDSGGKKAWIDTYKLFLDPQH